jgi:hypothetical protein
MINLLWILLLPLIVIIIARKVFHRTITNRETAYIALAITFLTIGGWFLVTYSNMHDVQIVNGQVISKERENTSHIESYSCNCRTVSNGKTSHMVCDTCFRTIYDVKWSCDTTVGRIGVASTSSRYISVWSTPDPKRYTDIIIGEPASLERSYLNYLKAAPSTLFKNTLSKNSNYKFPEYPRVYDLYRIRHVLNVNSKVSNLDEWNSKINDMLRSLGPTKQININLVFVSGYDTMYKQYLESKWLGGKKNDLVLIFGTDHNKIEWIEGFTFGKSSGNGELLVNLKSDLSSISDTKDVDSAITIISSNVSKSFVRKHMEDYSYLKHNALPSPKQLMFLMLIIGVLLTAGLILAHFYDF